MVGVPAVAAAASRAGPPDNGGSLFIYPSMRTDTADRLPFIGKSFLIPQMSADPGAITAEPPAIVAGTIATRRRLFRDVWLDDFILFRTYSQSAVDVFPRDAENRSLEASTNA